MSSVWIAGCGDLGRATGRLLAGAGHDVLGLRRNPPSEPEGPRFRYAAVDLTDPDGIAAIPEPPDCVLYMAAAPSSTEAAYEATYLRGLENLARVVTAGAGSPRLLLFVSSTAVYGDADGGWVDEDTPGRPEGFRGRVMLEAERLTLQTPGGRVARLSGIYGPGRTALVRRVLDGAACRPGTYGNRIHRDDAARMVVHLMNPDAEGRVFLGVDDAPADQCEVMRWLAKRLGVPPPRRDESAGASRANKRCCNRRLRQSGFDFLYPTYREGYEQVLGEMR